MGINPLKYQGLFTFLMRLGRIIYNEHMIDTNIKNI